MTQKEVMTQVCAMCTYIAVHKFKCLEPADCWCGGGEDPHFQFSQKVLDWLDKAIAEKLARERSKRSDSSEVPERSEGRLMRLDEFPKGV